ncbi:MAG: thiamine kinase [Paraglaciecola sp.]|jgi:thiamine kinase
MAILAGAANNKGHNLRNLTANIEKLTDEIASLGFIHVDFKLTAFNGGTVNSSYCLTSGVDKYFVKTFESDRVAMLDRVALFNLQQQLAALKLTPLPIYLGKLQNFQIDLWIDSPTLENSTLSNLGKTNRLAEALAHIHSIQIQAPPLNLPDQWVHYEKLIGRAGIADCMREEFSALWKKSCDSRRTLCHNDLAFNHLTVSDPVMIYDWEYCALSSPYFDIASSIAINGLSKTDEASLYAAYALKTGQKLSDVVSEVLVMKPLVELTNKLWYTAASQHPHY